MTKNLKPLKVFQAALSEALYEHLRHREDLLSLSNHITVPSGYVMEIATGKTVYDVSWPDMYDLESVELTQAIEWTQGPQRGFTAQFMGERDGYRFAYVYNVPDETLMNVMFEQASKDDSDEVEQL